MKCKEMRIYFFLFLVLWVGSVYAQNQPVILDKHNVIELNDAKEWNSFIKSWEAVPLKMDARNAVEIQSLAVYDDLVVVRGIRGQLENILLFDISGKFLRQIGSQGGGKEQYGMVGWVRVDPLEREIGVYDGFLRKRYVTYNFEGDFKGDGACEEYMHYVRGCIPWKKIVIWGISRVVRANSVILFRIKSSRNLTLCVLITSVSRWEWLISPATR